MDRIEQINTAIEQALDYYDGCLPEAMEEFNDLQRELVKTYAGKHGDAWLGYMGETKVGEPIWEYEEGDTIHTFGSSFVVPCDDDRLRELIWERFEGPYTGTADDAVKIQAILDRVEELGGELLIWT